MTKPIIVSLSKLTRLAALLFSLVSAPGFSQSDFDLIREYQFNEFRSLTPPTLHSDFGDASRSASRITYTGGSRSGCLAVTEQLPFQASSNSAVMGTATVSVRVHDYVTFNGFCPRCDNPRGCVVRPVCEPPQTAPTASAYQFRVELIVMASDGSRNVRTHGINNGASFFTGRQSFTSAELVVPAVRLNKQISWVQMRLCDIQATNSGAIAKLDVSIENMEIAKFWD